MDEDQTVGAHTFPHKSVFLVLPCRCQAGYASHSALATSDLDNSELDPGISLSFRLAS